MPAPELMKDGWRSCITPIAFYELHLPFKKLLTSKKNPRSEHPGGCDKMHSPGTWLQLQSLRRSWGGPRAVFIVGDTISLPSADLH